jgi:Flp pilus assembly protein TadB
MPTFEDMISRANFGSDRARFSSRMIRQIQSIRPTRDNKLSDTMRENLYRGGLSTDVMETNGDFFVFLRILCAVCLGAIGVVYVVFLHAGVFFLGLAVLGYLLPAMWATLHNGARKRKLLAALPVALPLLASAIDTEPDIRSALAKVAKTEEGPLYDELDWAAGQMAAAIADIYDVLRKLDARNNIIFFGPLADTAEREARQADARMRSVMRDYINEQLGDYYGELDKRLGNLPNKVIMAVALPMMLGVLTVIMGPIVLTLLQQLSHSGIGGK